MWVRRKYVEKARKQALGCCLLRVGAVRVLSRRDRAEL